MNKISISDKEKQKFESLSDLGKYHLDQNSSPSSSQFNLPLLGLKGLSIGSGFVLPKLNNFPPASVTSKGTHDLLDFAKIQLKNLSLDSSSSFMIPKIFPTTEVKSSNNFIDLKSALVPESEKKELFAFNPKKNIQIIENFIPKFISSDIRAENERKIQLIEDCEQITLKELPLKYENCSHKKFSPVGRVIKRKFRTKTLSIRHRYEFKHNIIRFTFDSPSPDDKILAYLNKNKN